MESDIRKLRAALARRKSGRGRRFSPELRCQITGVGRRLRSEGTSWNQADTHRLMDSKGSRTVMASPIENSPAPCAHSLSWFFRNSPRSAAVRVTGTWI